MNIQSLMKQIKEKTTIANDDLKDANNNTRAMRQGNKRAAEESLVGLKNEYRRLLLSTAAFVVVTGSEAASLTDLAKESNFTVNSEDLYAKVASKIDPRAYMNLAVGSSVIESLGASLEEVANEIGIQSYPQLRFESKYSGVIGHEAQFTELTKSIINNNVGGEIVGIYAVSSILENAIKKEHADSVTPILLTTLDKELAVTLSKDLKRVTKNVFVVSVGKSPGYIKNLPNSISIKEASPEALTELLTAIKGKSV